MIEFHVKENEEPLKNEIIRSECLKTLCPCLEPLNS